MSALKQFPIVYFSLHHCPLVDVLVSIILYLGLLSFPLEVVGDSLCGYNFKLLFIFFCSQKEALERARYREKPSHVRFMEENSPTSSSSSLVRMTTPEKPVINAFMFGVYCHSPSMSFISIESLWKV